MGRVSGLGVFKGPTKAPPHPQGWRPAPRTSPPLPSDSCLGLRGGAPAGEGPADRYLPKAATCFFALELPDYSCKEVLREKLMYAPRHPPAPRTNF